MPERAPEDKSLAPRRSRLEALRQAHGKDYQPPLPPLEGGEYLLGYLFEIGPALAGGLGPAPLTHGELRAWQDNTGIALMPWEARLLRRLSLEYVAASQAATERNAPPPWRPDDDGRPLPTAAQEALRNLTTL